MKNSIIGLFDFQYDAIIQSTLGLKMRLGKDIVQ